MLLGQDESSQRALRALDPKSLIVAPFFAHGEPALGGLGPDAV